MKHSILKRLAAACLVTTAFVGVGCGGNGASNNDQGVAVTLLGFFSSGNTDQGVTGVYMPMASPGIEPGSAPAGVGADPVGGVIVFVGLANNLTGQFVRIDRVLLDYSVPGAMSNPPATNYPLSSVIGPAANSDTVDDPVRRPAGTSLPSGFSAPNPVFAQVPVVPVQIREWINFNRGSLPEPPFLMEVHVRATGLTSSGNRVETNTETLAITVVPETFVAPTQGSSSSGTGTSGAETDTGSLSGEDGDSSGSSAGSAGETTQGDEGASL